MSHNILLVDDTDTIRDHLHDCLIHRGYTVVTAFNGSEAMRVIQDGHIPDLIITDLDMPVMDGNDLIRWLIANTYEMPVIVITGWTSFFDTHLTDRVCQIMTKPFRMEELHESIRQALGEEL